MGVAVPVPMIAAAGFLLAAAPAPIGAQDPVSALTEPVPALTLLGGVSQYDLSGTGTTPFFAARVDVPLGRVVVLEPGITYLPYEEQFGVRTHHLLPEVQLQVQRPGDRFRPYLGVGVGFSRALRPGLDESELTASVAAGTRVLTLSGWLVRGELRVRAIDPWTGTTADWSLGVGHTF